jgi:hypothetical protein
MIRQDQAHQSRGYGTSLPIASHGKAFRSQFLPYGLGELLVVVSVFVDVPGEEPVLTVVFDSVLLEAAGDSFTIVVLLSFFSPGGLVTVVSLCSQAASDAAPAKMQMYFFMTEIGRSLGQIYLRVWRRRGCRRGRRLRPRRTHGGGSCFG